MNPVVLFTESSDNVGGQELQAMQQMSVFSSQGFEVVLACRPHGRVARQAERLGLPVLSVPFANSLHIPSIYGLHSFIRNKRPMLIICHSGHDTNVAALACKLSKQAPFLLRSRTYLTGKNKPYSYNQLVDATMVPSAYLRNKLLETRGIQEDRVHVVYPGVDFARIRQEAQLPLPAPIAHWLSSHPGPCMLHAAMLRAEKGHEVILKAMAVLKNRWPNLRYLVAGEGPERARMEMLVNELGLCEQVFLAGAVFPVASLMQHADFLVMPSLYEPLGMSQIEALSLNLPVLASHVGGIPETVLQGDTGVLLPPGDVNMWAEAIDRALSFPEEQRLLAENGKADVIRRFSVERNFRNLLSITECRHRT